MTSFPCVDRPIDEYADFRYVPWSEGIYPSFKGEAQPSEAHFFADRVRACNAKSILDLAVGSGLELSGLIAALQQDDYPVDHIEANEVDDAFIAQATRHFREQCMDVTIHKANWIDLPERAEPAYEHSIDFAYLTGNSLTYVGGGTREHALSSQQQILSKFSRLIASGGHLFIDMRNYDYIRSLMDKPHEQIMELFDFDRTVYYHGTGDIQVFPAYMSNTLVALHYYDTRQKVWGKLDLFPICQEDMVRMLQQSFDIEAVYDDFENSDLQTVRQNPTRKTQFVQFLARKK